MPSRLLREGILDSEAVDQLSPPAEVFYRRLMSVVDDFGRFDGRTSVLRSRLYPLRTDSVREADITRWIAECEKAGLIALYAVAGKPYLLFHKLGSPRSKESKYPPPPTGTTRPSDPNRSDSKHMFADVNGCARMKTDVPYSYSGTGSGTGSGTDSGSGTGAAEKPAESVGPEPDVLPFDPLRSAEAARKEFERRWAGAGLRKFSRLSPSLQGQLQALLLDPWWAEHYPAALAKAGTIPFLRDGLNRANGPMDVAVFLRDADEARKILDGFYDPRAPAAPAARGRRQAELDAVFEEDARTRRKPQEGAA